MKTHLIRNKNQLNILYAETGIDRWNAAPVAAAIARRIARQDTIRITRQDVDHINRMAFVRKTGRYFPNPFQSLAVNLPSLEVQTSKILAVITY